MKFLIKPVNDSVKELYINHSTYHEGDSGLDLFIVSDEVIPAGETKIVDLGISCQLKDETKNMYYSYNMYARSSISKTPLRLANGVGLCDACYLGTIRAPLHNTGSTDFSIKRGDRYVQLARADLGEIKVELVDDFKRSTTRNTGGFGSTI